MVFRVVEHIIDGQHVRGYPHSTRKRQEDILKLAIKQYIPIAYEAGQGHDAVTIIATHGIGFPKEVYEPFFEALCLQLHAKEVSVRGIWIADMVNQNASGLLNEDLVGDQFDWFDGARDLLTMVNHFRSEMPRPIIGIGHSFGCAMLTKLSTMHPRLLSTVIYCEPVMYEVAHSRKQNIALGVVNRRDYWASRAEAEARLTKSLKKQGWADDTIALYLRYGLKSLPTLLYDPTTDPRLNSDGVTLVTTKYQEAWSFANINWKEGQDLDGLLRLDQTDADRQCIGARPQTTSALLVELPSLRPSVLYVFGGASLVSNKEQQDKIMHLTGAGIGGSGGATAGKVMKETVENSGHTLPLEEGGRARLVQLGTSWIEDWFRQYVQEETLITDLGSGNSDESGIKASKGYVEGLKSLINGPRIVPRPAKQISNRCGKL